jgi:hypothetical protein
MQIAVIVNVAFGGILVAVTQKTESAVNIKA